MEELGCKQPFYRKQDQGDDHRPLRGAPQLAANEATPLLPPRSHLASLATRVGHALPLQGPAGQVGARHGAALILHSCSIKQGAGKQLLHAEIAMLRCPCQNRAIRRTAALPGGSLTWDVLVGGVWLGRDVEVEVGALLHAGERTSAVGSLRER